MTALKGVFTGETEPLKNLGVVMTQTQLEAFALAQGIDKSLSEMSQAEKVALRYKYVLDKTKNAQGDFKRTSDGTANQMRITQERFKELQEQIGKKLIPIANKLLGWLQDGIKWFKELSPNMQDIILKIGAVAAAIGPLLLVLGTLIPAIAAIASPVGLVVLGLALLAAGLAWLEIKTGFFRKAFERLKPHLNEVYRIFNEKVLPVLKDIANFVKDQLIAAWNDLKEGIKRIREELKPYHKELKLIAIVLGGALLAALTAVIAVIVAFIAITVALVVAIARVVGWVAKFIGMLIRLGKNIFRSVNNFARTFNKFFDDLGRRIERAVMWFYNFHRKIDNAFQGARSWLFNAGKAIISGLVDGIKAVASAPVDAIKSVLSSARDLLPFSPAKKGPFSGKGWTLYSGQSMMKGLADGINQMSQAPEQAFANAMGRVNNVSNSSNTSIYGNINIGNRNDADYFLNKIDRNQQLSNLGMSIL